MLRVVWKGIKFVSLIVMDKKYLCGLDIDEISDLVKTAGFTRSQAVIAAGTLYRNGESGLHKTTRIPVAMKKYLLESASSGIYSPVKTEKSADGTVKHLFISPEGKNYESVYITEAKRRTVCVSSQSGCRMGCLFCVTGRYGFHGNLSAGDIVNQVISNPFRDKVTHVVFMGMGEPMDNTANVLKAAGILKAEWGLAISSRNITVSTVGITSEVKRVLEKSEYNLVLSLYSPFPRERIRVVPAERAYPAGEIINIMASAPPRKKRRLSIAYVMIKGVNDSEEHLTELKSILAGTGIRVNLLPYHTAGGNSWIPPGGDSWIPPGGNSGISSGGNSWIPPGGDSGMPPGGDSGMPLGGDSLQSSSDECMQSFRNSLLMSGIPASVRKSRGADISAACGLLASGMIKY